MQNFGGFQSWDETYVHTKHNTKDRTVLETRADNNGFEPWTWVRTEGKGRVFYTAWGHDERTWREPGFHNLVERGIRWAVGGDPQKAGSFKDPQEFIIPEMTAKRSDAKPLEYIDVGEGKIPNYKKGEKWGEQGEAITKMQKPLMPEESLKHIVTPVDFEPQLFMSEQDFNGGKPIAMTWDERGRLWFCETVDYPNELQPPGDGRDRIRIAEDTNHDGRADKFTIFAEKLSIPTSITFHRGGVIVQNGPETLYLKDTNGDDVADERKVLFTGWGIGDTHGQVSNFQYGHDNWIWAMQGYNNSTPVNAEGKKFQSFRMGFFRFKPDGSDLEFIRSTNNNTWGLGISEEGIIFGSTANHNPSVYMPIPNRYYEQVRGWSPQQLGTIADTYLFQPITDHVRQVDQFGGYTAGCGHALYTARTYPKEYWNRVAFVAEPTGHLVGSFVLRKEGADFTSSSPFNLFASTDEWTSPIMAEVGPDGHVWVLDWYNYIIQHNPTPVGFKTGKGNAYESELRDKKHGRVYRIVYKKAPANEPVNLKDASPEKLVATLKHPNLLWRRHAQRLLVERGNKDVVPSLVELVKDNSVDEIGMNVGAVHALWALKGLGEFDARPDFARNLAAFNHPSAAVRKTAFEVATRHQNTTEAQLALNDKDVHVRMAALLYLSESEKSNDSVTKNGSELINLIQNPENKLDRWSLDAATVAAAGNAHAFLKAFSSTKLIQPVSAELISLTERVAEHYARGIPTEQVGSLLQSFKSTDPAVLTAILSGLVKGWPENQPAKLTEAEDQAILDLFTKAQGESRGRVISLAARLGSQKLEKFAAEIAATYLTQIKDDKLAAKERIEAGKQLIEFRKMEISAVNDLLGFIGPKTAPDLAAGWIDAIRVTEAKAAGDAILSSLGRFTPAARASALQLLLGKEDWTNSLLAAMEKGAVQMSEFTLDQKQALASHPDKKLAARAKKLLEKGGGLPNADRQKVVEELMVLTKESGDAKAGLLVFEKQCAKCHMHSGKGNKIGPDLTGMSVHPKAELLVHIIDPSRSVEGNFRVYQVVMENGRVMTGLLASESKTAIELIDAEGKRHALVREEIEELNGSPKSLMPEGFEKQVSKDDIRNLLEFLTQRGKFTPIGLEKYATIVSTKGMFNSEAAEVERMIFADWSPKTFQGVPFQLVDPQGTRVPNVILLKGNAGALPPKMPASVILPCNQSAKAIHFLSGASGWGYPAVQDKRATMIVRLLYDDGSKEEHELLNGEHFSDYIRRVDVPKSQFAFSLRGQQIRYFAVLPKKSEKIKQIELLKGPEKESSPIVMAVTVEGTDSK
jgi:putative membrane-bound dehydrogenase-like protein